MHPLITILLTLSADPAPRGVDQAWADKARAALPGLIERRLEIAANLDEVNEHTVTVPPGAPAGQMKLKLRATRNETSRRGDDRLTKTVYKSDDKEPEETVVAVRNQFYDFKLTKRGEDGPYVLIDHSNDLPKGDWQGGQSVHMEMIDPMQNFRKALESKEGYVLRHLAWDTERSLVVAEYEVRANDPKANFECQCKFDPARGWAPVEQVTKTWAALFEKRLEYGFEIEGLAFPSLYESKSTYHVTPAPPNHVTRIAIGSLGPSNKTDRDFRLTAFGLPEPLDAPSLPRSGMPKYVYILMAAAACAVLAFLFRYFAKHRRRDL